MARTSGTDLASRSNIGTTQRVAIAHGGEGLVEAGAGAGRAGEAVTSVDAILGDAQLQERLALGGQSCRSVEQRAYPMSVAVMGQCTDRVPLPQFFPYHSYEWLLASVWRGSGRQTARPLDDPLTDSAAHAGMNG